MKKNVYDILKQSFYEINEHYMKYVSALALQSFLLISSILFLPPFGVILAFLVMIITQIGLARYSMSILNKKQEKINQVVEINKFTFSHIITFIIKVFQVMFFSLFLIIPGIIKCLEYSQIDFILADNEKLDTNEALLESKKITHNSRGKILMLFITHLFLSMVLVAFSASVVLLTTVFVQMSKTVAITWFSVMSVFLLFVIAMPFYTISRTILYENLKSLSKFNNTPKQSFMQEVAQEFMNAFKQNKKQTKTTRPKNQTLKETHQTNIEAKALKTAKTPTTTTKKTTTNATKKTPSTKNSSSKAKSKKNVSNKSKEL